MFKAFGFTISELLIVITIFSVLIWIAIPSFQELLIKNEANQIKKVLTIHIQKAKSEAQIRHKNVTLCASLDLINCHHNWNNGMIGFLDINNNRLRDPDEILLYAVPLNYKYGNLDWRGTLRVNSVTFQGDTGLPRGSNGSFFYCSSSPKYHKRIRLSSMGNITPEDISTC
ncbi:MULTISPECIES: GspH/FimT family pseudopilin [Acinetobacter]|uniref:GspH/FimT family pseudopilin n=1 Tax=Acinetobacter TaxID=469 RepID=UPI0020C99EF4|nr:MULTISPECIES: GspH/FimT family pseudopilin [Acinetobacter]UTO20152.1 GspH/FimT family pseudopilin [Acinetobacter sp. Z1]